VQWAAVRRSAAWVAGAVALVLAAFWWHDRRLRRELVERARVEAELRAARDRLAELNDEKTKLINMAAHDLRNPLTGVLLSLNFVDTNDERERRRVVSDLTRLSRHMLQLINDLLDLELLKEGRRVFRVVNFDFAELVREAALENEPAARRKRITLEAAADGPAAFVRADPGATRQVIDNLISNALKYSPVGARVRLAWREAGPVVRCEVRDEGPGIAPGDLPQLFTKFARLGGRPTGGESSLGLGLSIVRQLTESMEGRVWCESELGRGSTFIVELPAAPRLAGAECESISAT
jgi:signal transduction histidine kinase